MLPLKDPGRILILAHGNIKQATPDWINTTLGQLLSCYKKDIRQLTYLKNYIISQTNFLRGQVSGCYPDGHFQNSFFQVVPPLSSRILLLNFNMSLSPREFVPTDRFVGHTYRVSDSLGLGRILKICISKISGTSAASLETTLWEPLP